MGGNGNEQMHKNSRTAQHRHREAASYTALKKTRIENFEELCDHDEDTNPVRNELVE